MRNASCVKSDNESRITNYVLRVTHYVLRITHHASGFAGDDRRQMGAGFRFWRNPPGKKWSFRHEPLRRHRAQVAKQAKSRAKPEADIDDHSQGKPEAEVKRRVVPDMMR